MQDPHRPEVKPRRRLRLLKGLCVSLFVVLGILTITIYCLPDIVSSGRFRSLAEAKASEALRRPVHIGGLRWTWSDGISAHSLRIDDDPAFSREPLLDVRNITLQINLGDLLRRRFNGDFGIEGMKLRFIRNNDGVTNLEVLLSAFDKGVPKKPRSAKTLDEWRRFSLSLPFEVQGRVNLRDMSARIEDRSQGRVLSFGGASLWAEVASLGQMSLSIRAASEIDLDGVVLPPLRLDAKVRNLFTPEGDFSLSDASVVADGSLPGMTIDIRCDLRTPEIENKVQVVLPELMKIVRPFLPPSLADMGIAGSLEFVMHASGDPTKKLGFTLAFTGQDLGISGGPLKKNSLGPLRFIVTNEGEADLNKGKVTIAKGEVRFLKRNAVSWHGSIEETGDGQAAAEVALGPVSVDMDEVYRTARPFFPEGFGLDLEGLSRAQALTVGNIRLSGLVPKGTFTILLDDLALRVPAARLKQEGVSVSLGDTSLSISKLRVVLNDLFPSQAAVALSLRSEGLRIVGPMEVAVKGVDVSSFEISASDIRRARDALFGVATHIAFSGTQSLAALSVPGTAEIRDLQESLSAEVFLQPAPSIDINVKEFEAHSPSVSIKKGMSVPIDTAFSISTAMHMVLRKGADYEGDIKRLRSDVSLGTMLSAGINLTAERWGFGGLRADGAAKADLSQVMRYAPREIGRDLKLSGSANMRWSLAGRLPGKKEREEMKDPGRSLAALRDKDIIRNLDFTAALNALSMEFTAAEGQRLTVDGISTEKPLKMVMEKGLKKAGLSGSLSASVKELPHLGQIKKPLQVTLDLSASEEMLKTLSISQSSRVSQLNLKQEARLSVSGIDRLLSRGLEGPVARLLEFIGAQASVSLDMAKTDVPLVKEDITVAGTIAAGADFDVLPGREVGLGGWLRTPGLNVTLGKLMDLRDLKSNLAVAKRFRLSVTEGTGSPGTPSPYLSVQVLKPATETSRRGGTEGPAVRRLMSDVRAEGAGRRGFSAESVHIGVKPLPVDITHTVVDFSLEEGLPSIDFFQADILGGTVRGSLSLKRRNGVFAADFRSAFSGLNAKRLIAGPFSEIRDEEAEMSGVVSASLPISVSMGRLLQDVEFDVEMTHIGARALDRMLYALDPYENNEAIVQQRKLLRMGTPRWAKAAVKNGMLSASGEVEVKGVKLELPSLERINVAALPGFDRFEKRLAVIGPVIKTLNILSADTVEVDRDGKIRLSYKGE